MAEYSLSVHTALTLISSNAKEGRGGENIYKKKIDETKQKMSSGGLMCLAPEISALEELRPGDCLLL